jgi:hypothetical protein
MDENENVLLDPHFEKMISDWKKIYKEKWQEDLCRYKRKMNKKYRKELINNGKVC